RAGRSGRTRSPGHAHPRLCRPCRGDQQCGRAPAATAGTGRYVRGEALSAGGVGQPAAARTAAGVAVWPPFVRAAVALAATAGFSLGAAFFAVSALSLPIGLWWS